MKYIYWYDPTTGEILRRTQGTMAVIDLPFIEHEEFDYYNYRVNVETQELIHEPNPNVGTHKRFPPPGRSGSAPGRNK